MNTFYGQLTTPSEQRGQNVAAPHCITRLIHMIEMSCIYNRFYALQSRERRLLAFRLTLQVGTKREQGPAHGRAYWFPHQGRS